MTQLTGCLDCPAEIPAWSGRPAPRRCPPCRRARENAIERARRAHPGARAQASERWAAYSKGHRAQLLEGRRAYREANRARIAARRAETHQLDPEPVRRQNRLHRERHPEVHRAAQRRRAARLRGVEVRPYSDLVIFERDAWTCGICGEDVDATLRFPNNRSATIDHIVPISLGGGDVEANVQLAHYGCNAGKRDRVGFSQPPNAGIDTVWPIRAASGARRDDRPALSRWSSGGLHRA